MAVGGLGHSFGGAELLKVSRMGKCNTPQCQQYSIMDCHCSAMLCSTGAYLLGNETSAISALIRHSPALLAMVIIIIIIPGPSSIPHGKARKGYARSNRFGKVVK
ncbi:putative ribosomal large subunit pseudouridinesynthase [Anopheles sinensis]|uniref:Putative ribosomal large subunit pseudouridinesynthase n=1 Tax=Anopheles sinensis TaxID=74873 RepID=A0A084VV51_ANOSI|nr:putative ribosomal large subunit pseudouridinesynthase [Anopheles sinensis]